MAGSVRPMWIQVRLAEPATAKGIVVRKRCDAQFPHYVTSYKLQVENRNGWTTMLLVVCLAHILISSLKHDIYIYIHFINLYNFYDNFRFYVNLYIDLHSILCLRQDNMQYEFGANDIQWFAGPVESHTWRLVVLTFRVHATLKFDLIGYL